MREKLHTFKSLDGAAYIILVAIVFLLPLFFIPAAGFSLSFAKATLLQIGASAALLLWLVARLRDGQLMVPKTLLTLSAFAIPLIAFVSALFSDAVRVSLFGSGGETTTVVALLFFFVLFFLSTQLVQKSSRIAGVTMAFLASALLVAIFETVRFFAGVDTLTFGVFNSAAANPVGKWNDLALFLALASALSVFSLQKRMVRGIARPLTYLLLVLSLFFLVVANFTLAWVLLGIFTLVFFVHGFLNGTRDKHGRRPLPVLALVVAAISLILLLSGGPISEVLNERLGIFQVEVRPSWGSTIDVVKQTASEDPVLGVGPNRFSHQWLMHKPDGVNQTFFWNTDFDFGISMAMSFLVTVGILGFLAWVLFLGHFLLLGSRAIAGRIEGESALSFSSFLVAVFLWLVAVFYVPGFSLFALAFLFSGVTVGALVREGRVGTMRLSFVDSPRIGFVAVLVLIVAIVLSVVAGYFFIQRTLASAAFGNGLEFSRVGNLAKAERSLVQATNLYRYDSFYRGLANVRVARLNNVLSREGGDQDELRAEFQTILGDAISSAQAATEYDKTQPDNWMTLGGVYAAVTPLEIQGASERAQEAYANAQKYSPKDPGIHVAYARLHLSGNDVVAAKDSLNEALALKNNHTGALFLLSQIEVQQGNLREAIRQTERASITSPNNVGIFFQLGFLRYQRGNYEEAISALERAVRLNPVYANAKYFLGLAYEKMDRTEDAIAQFEDVSTLNPGNNEVRKIIANIQAGNDPFAEIVPPEEPPEERDELPVDE